MADWLIVEAPTLPLDTPPCPKPELSSAPRDVLSPGVKCEINVLTMLKIKGFPYVKSPVCRIKKDPLIVLGPCEQIILCVSRTLIVNQAPSLRQDS